MLSFELLGRVNDGFTERLVLVQPHQWEASTPCAAWDVRAPSITWSAPNRRHTMLLHGAARRTRSTPPVPPIISETIRFGSFITTANGVGHSLAPAGRDRPGSPTTRPVRAPAPSCSRCGCWTHRAHLGPGPRHWRRRVPRPRRGRSRLLRQRDTFETGRQRGTFAPSRPRTRLPRRPARLPNCRDDPHDPVDLRPSCWRAGPLRRPVAATTRRWDRHPRPRVASPSRSQATSTDPSASASTLTRATPWSPH